MKEQQLPTTRHSRTQLHWLDDCRPNLKTPEASGLKFDMVLLSAVWVQLKSGVERSRAFGKMANMLKPEGILVITLRHGPSPDERVMHPVSREEVLRLGRDQALRLVLHDTASDDLLQRSKTSWETLVFRLPYILHHDSCSMARGSISSSSRNFGNEPFFTLAPNSTSLLAVLKRLPFPDEKRFFAN